MKRVKWAINVAIELLALPFLLLAAFVSRWRPRPIQVGLGPSPSVNHIGHQAALQKAGYTSQTYTNRVSHIVDRFDVRADHLPTSIAALYLFLHAIFTYQALYIYFDGGALCETRALRWIEPWLYRIAKIKVVVFPYGSDVQELTRSRNLLYRQAMASQYPSHRLRRRRIVSQVDRWTIHANHVVSGCDWIDYMYHWDSLSLAHFTVDIKEAAPWTWDGRRPLRILHAPNHREIKGSRYFLEAIEELQRQGCSLELRILERVPREEVLEAIAWSDLVAEQLIVGWYGMFAVEAMGMGRPVMAYLNPAFVRFYTDIGIVKPGEIPIVRATPRSVKQQLASLLKRPEELAGRSARSLEFARQHHSVEATARHFQRINERIEL
jgi:hypothetical protein